MKISFDRFQRVLWQKSFQIDMDNPEVKEFFVDWLTDRMSKDDFNAMEGDDKQELLMEFAGSFIEQSDNWELTYDDAIESDEYEDENLEFDPDWKCA